jgi:hypothetical protein
MTYRHPTSSLTFPPPLFIDTSFVFKAASTGYASVGAPVVCISPLSGKSYDIVEPVIDVVMGSVARGYEAELDVVVDEEEDIAEYEGVLGVDEIEEVEDDEEGYIVPSGPIAAITYAEGVVLDDGPDMDMGDA